jgi:uncharacterized DUF497 family protein
MEFQWDEAKNRSNIAKHGIDFREAEAVFVRARLVEEDDRFDYGERRKKALGTLESGVVVVVVFTERTNGIRIISVRSASRSERKNYEQALR